MPFTSPPLQVERAQGRRQWLLLRPLAYAGSQGDEWTVPAGFVTDLASIPSVLKWLVDDDGTWTQAAVLHDWLCGLARHGLMSRRDADGVLRRVLRELEVPWLRRWMIWAAVRIGGAFAGGMTAKESVQFAALLVPGLVAGTVSALLLGVRAVFAVVDWLTPTR